MNLQHVNVKIFVEGEMTVDMERFIEVFHQWVGEQSMSEMLIDVADYSHVPMGPGVVLVGLKVDYSIDHTDGRYGLRYNRKAPSEGGNAEQLRDALCEATKACVLLENEIDGLKFSRNEFEVSINDRAFVPNTEENATELQSELTQFAQNELGGASEISLNGCEDRRRLLSAVVRLSGPVDFAALAGV